MFRNILKAGLVLGFVLSLVGCGTYGCGAPDNSCGAGQMDHEYK